MEITNFKIKKLFGYMNVDIPIKNNKLILIGVNGTGKTTILTMLFYFLRGDFVELSAYNFVETSAVINGTEYKISYSDLEKSLFELSPKLKKFKDSFFPNYFKHKIYPLLLKKEYEESDLKSLVVPLIANARASLEEKPIPSDVIYQQISEVREQFHYLNIKQPFFIQKTLNKIKNELGNTQILFLPTFRRIEREFHDIFGFTLPNELKERMAKNKNTLTMVNFSMEDVFQRFSNLSNFSPSILEFELECLIKEAEKLLNESDSISTIEKNSSLLLNKMRKINEKKENASRKNYARKLEQLIAVSNKYLSESSKNATYDKDLYRLIITTYGKYEVDLQSLSSGEKQILSIFSELYLAEDDKNFIIIIDEPELSLSVLWQERFLPDILDTGKCKFLATVTHSPFIYTNLKDSRQEITRLCTMDE